MIFINKNALLIALLSCSVMMSPLAAPDKANASGKEPTVSVKLSNYLGNQSSINLVLKGNFEGSVLSVNTAYKVSIENNSLVLYKGTSKINTLGTTFTIIPSDSTVQNLININGKDYIGSITLTIENGKYIRPINTVPMEQYLKGVVPYEMSDSWGKNGGLEALKAQAVTARTFSMRYGSSVISDTQNHQVYGGYKLYPEAIKAVEETRGKVAKYNDKLMEAFYSSSNGGKILSNTNAWGSALIPYLKTKDDPYDIRSANSNVNWNFSLNKIQIDLAKLDLSNPNYWWSSTNELNFTPASNIKTWLINNGYINSKYEAKIVEIKDIWFSTSFDSSDIINGRVELEYMLKDKNTNTFVMEDGQIKRHRLTISRRAYDIRSMIGTTIMKSPYIKNISNELYSFTVSGGGWGHGIGMSQYGAYQMSKEGKGFNEILNFYFPSTQITDEYSPSINNVIAELDKNNLLTINFDIDEHANVTLSLRNINNGTTSAIDTNKAYAAGRNTATFDAKKLDGEHELLIVAKDADGNSSTYKQAIYINKLIDTESVNLTLNLTERAFLYTDPFENDLLTASLSPQKVKAIEKTRDGRFYRINTWMGPHWIKPNNVIIGEMKKIDRIIPLTERVHLYTTPFEDKMTNHSLSPQNVYVIEQWKEYLKINTWLGPMYIKHNIPEPVSFNKNMVLTERTILYGYISPYSTKYGTLSPQKVTTTRKLGDWYEVKTYLGPKWINPTKPIIDEVQIINDYIELKERKELYLSPNNNAKTGGTVAPQKVYAIERLPDWILIKTWLGNLYIKG